MSSIAFGNGVYPVWKGVHPNPTEMSGENEGIVWESCVENGWLHISEVKLTRIPFVGNVKSERRALISNEFHCYVAK